MKLRSIKELTSDKARYKDIPIEDTFTGMIIEGIVILSGIVFVSAALRFLFEGKLSAILILILLLPLFVYLLCKITWYFVCCETYVEVEE